MTHALSLIRAEDIRDALVCLFTIAVGVLLIAAFPGVL